MFRKFKQKISSAIQEGLALSESLQQQYQQNRKSTPTTPTVAVDINSISSVTLGSDDWKISNDDWTIAGVGLLDKYENDWKEISESNEKNAQIAEKIARNIDVLEMRMHKQQIVMRDFNACLAGLPEVCAKLKASEEILQQVQALSEIVEEKFKRLQDLCEECDLQEFMLHKQCELSQYKQKKMGKFINKKEKTEVNFNNNCIYFQLIWKYIVKRLPSNMSAVYVLMRSN